MASVGPVYQIDLQNNTIIEHSLFIPSLPRVEEGDHLQYYDNGKNVKAMLGKRVLKNWKWSDFRVKKLDYRLI